LLKDIKTAAFWKTAPASAGRKWKDPSGSNSRATAASRVTYGYVQQHDVDKAVVGWRLNASLGLVLVDAEQAP
jgi:hypothetical protein